MMLSAYDVRRFYREAALDVPPVWNLSRKHFRVMLDDGRFLKLNKFENRVNVRALRKFCVRFAPSHVYFSVQDWLFPERVGKKHKANRAVPVGGEFVVDVDSHLILWKHNNHFNGWNVCVDCLGMSKWLTLQVCEALEMYYSRLAIVFSGKRGFHVHALDFSWRDWAKYNERDPIKTYEVARFKFSQEIASQTYTFDRPHFILSVDPMRVVAFPESLNADTGLVCLLVGGRRDLEQLKISELLERSKPLCVCGYPEPLVGCENMR